MTIPAGWTLPAPVVLAAGLRFPTGLAVDDGGRVYVAESGLAPGGASPGGRVWRLDTASDRPRRALVADGLAAPVTGLCWHEERLYVAEGGAGRISRIDPYGGRTTIVAGLPGPGDPHPTAPVVGPDRGLYFGRGALSRLAVLGPAAAAAGARPGSGSRSSRTAAVVRCALDGSGVERVASGLRNAFGLGFLPDGRLLALDQRAHPGGSAGDPPDLLFEVVPAADRPPRVVFEPHVSATAFAVVPGTAPAFAGQLVVALFGDQAPDRPAGARPVGGGLLRVDPADWSTHRLAADLPLSRPVDVAFGPDGALYVLDAGEFDTGGRGVVRHGSGCLWRWEDWT